MVYLVAGVFAGLVVFSIPLDVYTRGNGNKDTIKTEEVAFYENSIGETQDQKRHWDPISGKSILDIHGVADTKEQWLSLWTNNPKNLPST